LYRNPPYREMVPVIWWLIVMTDHVHMKTNEYEMIHAIMIWIHTTTDTIWYDTIWYDTIDPHHVDSCRFDSILTSYPSLFFKFALKLFNLHPPHHLPQQTVPKLKYVMRVLVKQKLKCASIFKAILFIVWANMLLQYVTMMLWQQEKDGADAVLICWFRFSIYIKIKSK
jgi:hypothetical protein